MSKIYTIEEAKSILFEKHNGKIELIEYNGMYHKKSAFKCLVCGNIWNTFAFGTILEGHGCRKCRIAVQGEEKRYSDDYVINYINDNGCKLIKFIQKYKTYSSPLLVEFQCGHVQKTNFHSILNGKRLCNSCSKNISDKKKTKTAETVIDQVSKIGFTFVEFPNGYKNGSSYISYKCEYGHITTRRIAHFLSDATCSDCKRIKMSITQLGSKSYRWKGGFTNLKKFLLKHIKDWKKESMVDCNYKCVITGKKFTHIHHLYSFANIIQESLNNLGLVVKENIGEYSQDDIFHLVEEVQRLHKKYPLGVCLSESVHKLFHQTFKYGENTPDQWYEFVSKIKSGEIKIS